MNFNNKEFPYSFSQDRVYNDCPRKYKFKYVEGLKEPSNDNLDLGNAIHKVLEFRFWEDNTKKTKEIDNAINYICDKKGLSYFTQMLQELTFFFEDKELLHSELCLDAGGFICKVDLVYKDTYGNLVLTDYKVTKKPKSILSIYDEGQLLFYKHKFVEHYPDIGWDNILVQYVNILPYNSKNIVSWTTPINPTELECSAMYKTMLTNVDKINNNEFPKRTKWCNWCYFKDVCK